VGDVEIFWSVVGRGAAVIGVVVALVQGIRYLYQLMPSAKAQQRIDEMEKHLERDFEHLKKHDDEIAELNKKTDDTSKKIDEVNTGVQRLGKSQIALLRHSIDGNGIDGMRKEVDDLTDFFIDR